MRYPLYFASHPDQRKLVMEALEDSYDHRTARRYDQLDLQLITPLLPRSDWLAELGVTEDQYWKVDRHARQLHLGPARASARPRAWPSARKSCCA